MVFSYGFDPSTSRSSLSGSGAYNPLLTQEENNAFNAATTATNAGLYAQSQIAADEAAKNPPPNDPQAHLKQQILAQNTMSKWTGEGWGSTDANAGAMASVLAKNGITDINQFGQRDVMQTMPVTYKDYFPITDENGNQYLTEAFRVGIVRDLKGNLVRPEYNYDGYIISSTPVDPNTASRIVSKAGYYDDSYQWTDTGARESVSTFKELTPDQVQNIQNGQVTFKTGAKEYYNKATGQAIAPEYDRAGGNIWSGTFAGEGSTGFGVQFAPDGTPYFYTQFGGSTNDLANLMSIPALNVLANIAATAAGGPLGAAALNAATAIANGGDVGDVIKSAGLGAIAGAIGGEVTSALTDTLGATAAKSIGNLAAAEIKSGGNADPVSALVSGGLDAGTNAVLSKIDGFKDLSPSLQKSITAAVSNTLQTGSIDPAKAISTAIAAATSMANEAKAIDPYFQTGAGTGALPTDSSSTVADSGALPGINVAATDTGTASDAGSGLGTIEVSGVPIFADSKNADKVKPPFGYDLMPSSFSDTKPEGAYYDITQNAWFMPNQDAQKLSDALVNPEPTSGLPSAETTTDLPADNTLYENNGTPSTTDETTPTTPVVTEPTGALPATTETQPATPVGGLPETTPAPVDEIPEMVITDKKDDYSGLPGDIANQDPGTTVTPTPAPTTTTPVITTPITTTTTPSTTTTTPSAPTQPSASPTNPFGVLKLDSSPQMLTSTIPKSSVAKMAELHQLFNSLTPEMKSVLSDRGITPPTEASMPETTEAASGGLISDETSKILDSLNPKYIKSANLLPSVEPGKQEYRLGALKHLAQGPLKGPTLSNRMAGGGLPHKYSEAAPEGHNPEFITGLTGYYAQGGGTGQSDDISAMLHDGDYVMDADTVAALGDGSSKAGAEVLDKMRKQIPHQDGAAGSPVPAKIADGEFVFPASFVTAIGGGSNKLGAKRLDEMREKIRAHKRSAPTSKIPPKAKSPLDYLKMAKG